MRGLTPKLVAKCKVSSVLAVGALALCIGVVIGLWAAAGLTAPLLAFAGTLMGSAVTVLGTYALTGWARARAHTERAIQLRLVIEEIGGCAGRLLAECQGPVLNDALPQFRVDIAVANVQWMADELHRCHGALRLVIDNSRVLPATQLSSLATIESRCSTMDRLRKSLEGNSNGRDQLQLISGCASDIYNSAANICGHDVLPPIAVTTTPPPDASVITSHPSP